MLSSQFLRRLQAELLPFVDKPMRYVGNELNAVRKDPRAVRVHGVFCFPDVYDIGMSHHGLQILYHIVNRHPSWALSRCFHPWRDAEAIMREKRIPLWALEYGTPLADADWLGFTVQYELQCTGILNMLDLAGIPVRSAERADGAWPLVVCGGPCMINPEPLAEFVDAVVVGDGERVIEDICRVLERAKADQTPRGKVLEELATLQGIYVPSRYPARDCGAMLTVDTSAHAPVRAARVAQLDDDDYPRCPLVPLIDVVHHRLAVEVMRGCTRGCRFCSAGMAYRPVREREVPSVRRQVELGCEASGWREVGLLSLSTADYGGLAPLLDELRTIKERRQLSFSLPSTRVDALSREELDNLYRVSNATSITIAPEAGSERLRRVINKGFTDEQIVKTVEILSERNVQTLKLYFMVGLPTETDEDIEAIVSLVKKLAGMVRERSRRRMVHVAISPFSPKPWTPFQWEAMAPVELLNRRGAAIKHALAPLRNVKVSYRDADVTRLETVIARGDRRIGALVHAAWRAGARLDGWDEMFDAGRWSGAAEQLNISLDTYTGDMSQSARLPWEVVQPGVSMQFLRMERDLALSGMPTDDCRTGQCSACGACSLVARHLVKKEPAPASRPDGMVFGRGPRVGQAGNTGLGSERRFCRVVYRKGDAVRFLGHRDMVNTIQRALLVAGVPLEFSQGFHPHPRVSFGPPLPLGAAGERELFDMALTTEYHPEIGRLNGFLPSDLELVELGMYARKPTALSAEMAASHFVFGIPDSSAGEALRDRVGALLSRESVVVRTERKGKTRERDIRPLIVGLETPDDRTLAAVLRSEQQHTCSPRELLLALFPETPFDAFVVTRTCCYGHSGGELVAW